MSDNIIMPEGDLNALLVRRDVHEAILNGLLNGIEELEAENERYVLAMHDMSGKIEVLKAENDKLRDMIFVEQLTTEERRWLLDE